MVVLLTDLAGYFQFFWIRGKEIIDCMFGRAQASIFLKLLASPPVPASEAEDTQKPYLERCTLTTPYGLPARECTADGLQATLARER